jgi:hypothetical protein
MNSQKGRSAQNRNSGTCVNNLRNWRNSLVKSFQLMKEDKLTSSGMFPTTRNLPDGAAAKKKQKYGAFPFHLATHRYGLLPNSGFGGSRD